MKRIAIVLSLLLTASAAWAVTERFDSLDMNSNAVTDLPAPSASTDAVRKSYVEGKNVIFVSAGSMRANAGSNRMPCGIVDDSGTNDLTSVGCLASLTADLVDFQVVMPNGWNEGTLTFQVIWTPITGSSSSDNERFALSCVGISNGDTLNATMGTPATANSPMSVSSPNILYMTEESGAVTCAGTPAAGDLVAFRLSTTTPATWAGEVLMLGVKIFWTSDVHNEP